MLAAGIPSDGARASETDQFTLPTTPLDDLGGEIGARTLEILLDEIAAINRKIDDGTLQGATVPVDPDIERHLVERIYLRLGFGLPEATMERWIRYDEFPGRSIRFRPAVFTSIYAGVVSPFPFALTVFDSPTIRLYGVDLGTDKIGHFFQQGAAYFDRHADARAAGVSDDVAIDLAVQYGVLTEATFFGVGLTGVYSNADLAANYAGFKFYRNLFRSMAIDGMQFAPIVLRDGDHWILNTGRAGPDLLKPYVSEHLNEAYNPSKYVFAVGLIRRHVRDRCQSWFAQVPGFNAESYRADLLRARTWFGEAYGWDLPEENAATLRECFATVDNAREGDPDRSLGMEKISPAGPNYRDG